MKKYILILLSVFLVSATFVACDVETDIEPRGTNVQDVAGKWTVTFEQSIDEYNYIFGDAENPNLEAKTVEELEAIEWADLYGSGKVSAFTYNTAYNSSSSMWFSDYAASADDASFWQFKIKVDVDYAAKTFSAATTPNTSYEDCDVTIIGGEVMLDAATTPRGVVADSIVAFVKFSDDSNGYTYMKMSGYRYTGFDDDK
jgi:hypothetical protein